MIFFRQARGKSGSVDAVPKSQQVKGAAAQKGTPSKTGNNKQVTKPSAQKTQVKQAPSKVQGKGGKKGKKGLKHQQYDLIVTIDLVSGSRLLVHCHRIIIIIHLLAHHTSSTFAIVFHNFIICI